MMERGDMLTREWFFLENDGIVRHIYFNPDSSCGNSFVENRFEGIQFMDAWKRMFALGYTGFFDILLEAETEGREGWIDFDSDEDALEFGRELEESCDFRIMV